MKAIRRRRFVRIELSKEEWETLKLIMSDHPSFTVEDAAYIAFVHGLDDFAENFDLEDEGD